MAGNTTLQPMVVRTNVRPAGTSPPTCQTCGRMPASRSAARGNSKAAVPSGNGIAGARKRKRNDKPAGVTDPDSFWPLSEEYYWLYTLSSNDPEAMGKSGEGSCDWGADTAANTAAADKAADTAADTGAGAGAGPRAGAAGKRRGGRTVLATYSQGYARDVLRFRLLLSAIKHAEGVIDEFWEYDRK